MPSILGRRVHRIRVSTGCMQALGIRTGNARMEERAGASFPSKHGHVALPHSSVRSVSAPANSVPSAFRNLTPPHPMEVCDTHNDSQLRLQVYLLGLGLASVRAAP